MNRESFSMLEASRLLGVSRWTIYRMVHRGALAAFTVDGTGRGRPLTRIHLSELRRYKREQLLAVDVDPPRSTK